MFEDYKGLFLTGGVSNLYKKNNYRYYIENTNCSTKSYQIEFDTNFTSSDSQFAPNEKWGIKDFRTIWFYCPLACLSCTSSTNCNLCEANKCYDAAQNICRKPYNSINNESCKKLTKTSGCAPILQNYDPKRIILTFGYELN